MKQFNSFDGKKDGRKSNSMSVWFKSLQSVSAIRKITLFWREVRKVGKVGKMGKVGKVGIVGNVGNVRSEPRMAMPSQTKPNAGEDEKLARQSSKLIFASFNLFTV